MRGNKVSKEMKDLAKKCDTRFKSAVVLIHNSDKNNYNILNISISGKNKDKVSKRAMNMSNKIRKFDEFKPEIGCRLTVECKTPVQDNESDMEHYDISIMMDKDGV